MSTEINWDDLDDLERQVTHLKNQFPSTATFVAGFDLKNRSRQNGFYVPDKVHEHIDQFIAALYEAEEFTTPLPPAPARYRSFEGAQYRDQLLSIRHALSDPNQTRRAFRNFTVDLVVAFMSSLPDFPDEGVEAATVFAFNVIDVRELALDFFRLLGQRPAGLLQHIVLQLEQNCEPQHRKPLPPIADFKGSMPELIDSYFANTPFIDLFLTPLPLIVPPAIPAEQNKLPYDPDHPKHHCYQCHRPLPPDFATKHWQQLSYPKGPFFDTERCKTTALNRHQSDITSSEEALHYLATEYDLYTSRYEQDKNLKDSVQVKKDKEAQERREERDLRDWQRDQDRLEAEWKREQEKLRKELDAEALCAAEERAQAELVSARPVSEAARLENTVIVAGAGWGKTQLLQAIIASDLQKPNPPSYIVLDSTGAMVETIQRLEIFSARLRDRILIVDPKNAPALNMLDFSAARFRNLSEDEREDLEAEVIRLFNYIFASTEYDLSGQMGTAFSYAIKLIINRPGSTIRDLQRLLEDKATSWTTSSFKTEIEQLRHGREFFENQFFSDGLRGTRASIARRIHSLLGIGAFRRMFDVKENRLDLFTEMNNGTIILVNTNVNMLKEDGMEIFGRYIIASVLSAAFERAPIPIANRRPTFLVIDEASPYFDENFEKLFTRARQYRLATVCAFQHLMQAPERIKAGIMSSTRVKYAAALGMTDRNNMAQEMETTSEFIASLKKDLRDPDRPEWAEFACYVRPDFSTACVQTVPFYQLENMPRMSNAAHQQLLVRNRERLSIVETPKASREDLSASSQEQAEAAQPIAPRDIAASSHADQPQAQGQSNPTHMSSTTRTLNAEVPISGTSDPGEPSSDWKPQRH